MTVFDAFSLRGKTALVTGARRGIGLAIAAAFAEAGADIIAVSTSIELEGSEVERQVRAAGRSFTALPCDLSQRDAVSALLSDLDRRAVPIDILVNNAGTIRRAPAVDHSDADWDAVMEVNLRSPFALARALGRKMIERGSGKIIFTASLLSFQGGINVASYTASKGAIAQLTKALANEWAGKGVNVNALAPGYIRTDNTHALQNDPVRYESILARIPAGHWGYPADLVGPALFLASSASNYVHGEVLVVDGGWMGR